MNTSYRVISGVSGTENLESNSITTHQIAIHPVRSSSSHRIISRVYRPTAIGLIAVYQNYISSIHSAGTSWAVDTCRVNNNLLHAMNFAETCRECYQGIISALSVLIPCLNATLNCLFGTARIVRRKEVGGRLGGRDEF